MSHKKSQDSVLIQNELDFIHCHTYSSVEYIFGAKLTVYLDIDIIGNMQQFKSTY
ncbi:hypothetical protein [Methanosalsum zhilinae]|uniref:hypothetical protein n=1 Tax=Methanosalsum zhilinae TaxID=39669 RepID=UPI00155A281B|nr:hypothetical protein [Methanosalsum zhilinae]